MVERYSLWDLGRVIGPASLTSFVTGRASNIQDVTQHSVHWYIILSTEHDRHFLFPLYCAPNIRDLQPNIVPNCYRCKSFHLWRMQHHGLVSPFIPEWESSVCPTLGNILRQTTACIGEIRPLSAIVWSYGVVPQSRFHRASILLWKSILCSTFRASPSAALVHQ